MILITNVTVSDTEEASETELPNNDDPPETQNERKEQ